VESDHLKVDNGEQQGVYRPMSAAQPAALPHVKSRWQKGTLTFGPVGRISWTLVIVALPLFVFVFGGIAGILFVVPWCGVVAPMALRDIWAKDSVYVPVPPIPPLQSMTTINGDRIPTLEEYVASQGDGPSGD
jgi:hypothetical protein